MYFLNWVKNNSNKGGLVPPFQFMRIPPLEKRFKKGVSGNPYGRPRIIERDVFMPMTSVFELFIRYKNRDRSIQAKLRRIKEIVDEK